jgi:hypothetical protein
MYEKLLKRFADTFHTSKSEQFRSLLARLTEAFPYETRWDNPGYDELLDSENADSDEQLDEDQESTVVVA